MTKFIFTIILSPLLFIVLGCETHEVKPEINQSYFLFPEDKELALGNFNVLEGFHGFPGDRNEILPLYEVAIIGATYVLEVFGYNLDGMYMELTFNYNPHISHRTWIGNVANSADDFEGFAEGFHPRLITFSIDAVTDERINIMNHRLNFF